MLGQSQLLLCIIPSGRQYISHVLKKNWSLQMWSCMPSGPQSCIRSFSLSVHCCIVKKRAMTESHVAQHFSVLTWAPRPMMASMSIKTNVPSENRDLKAKCLSCNREARQMSHIFCLRRMKATFFFVFVFHEGAVTISCAIFLVSKEGCVPAALDVEITACCDLFSVFAVQPDFRLA